MLENNFFAEIEGMCSLVAIFIVREAPHQTFWCEINVLRWWGRIAPEGQ